MTTTTLIIVIAALSGTLFIVLLPIDKMAKAVFCGVTGVVLVAAAFINNATAGIVPTDIHMRIMKAPTQEAKQCLMAKFKVTEAALNIKAENELKTPLEISGGILASVALILSWFLVVVVRNSNDKESQKAYQIVIVLTAAATAYLLSLYYGMQLGLIAWMKKNKTAAEKHVVQTAE